MRKVNILIYHITSEMKKTVPNIKFLNLTLLLNTAASHYSQCIALIHK